MMKKVVIFAGPYHPVPPTKGAAVETWIYEVSKRIITCQMHIISVSNEFLPAKELKDGIYFHRIKFSKMYKRVFQKILGWDIYSYNKRIFNIIKKIDPNIVHIHNYYNSKEIIEWIKNYNRNIKIILHMHNLSEKFKKGFPDIDLFIGCSNYITKQYKKFIKANKFLTIYDGVDIRKYSKVCKSKQAVKSILNIDKKKTNIFYFGRISAEKGVDKFVETAKLFKDNLNYNFYCIGEISQKGSRKKYFDSLIKTIEKNQLRNIKFLDYVAPSKIHIAYKMADLVIIPSRSIEGFNMTTIEAMASRVPTICAYNGGMKEYLTKSNSLIVEDYDNFAEIAKSHILNTASNPALKEKIIESGYETAKNLDWANIAAKLESIYNEI